MAVRLYLTGVVSLASGVTLGVVGTSIYSRLNISEDVEKSTEFYFTDQKLTEYWKRYGFPSSFSVLPYKRHVVGYDQTRRIPLWVAQHISGEQLKGNAEREFSQFKVEKRIPSQFRASNEDYLRSGFSRGHLVPAADNNQEQQAMDETFYLSNIIPQNHENNAGYWYRMEHYCRQLSKRFSDIYVISGPVFRLQCDQQNEHKFVRYQVIGKNNVAVPTHLFKVILVENFGTPVAIGSFVIPNEPIPSQRHLKSYQVDILELEKETGFVFFSNEAIYNLPKLCTVDGCTLLKQEMVDFKNLSRKLKIAKSLQDLERIWMDAKSHPGLIKPSVIEIYKNRHHELSEIDTKTVKN